MTPRRRRAPVLVTATWFTDPQHREIAHSLAYGGQAACSPSVISPAATSGRYWKSDMPDSVKPCPVCERILGGERGPAGR